MTGYSEILPQLRHQMKEKEGLERDLIKKRSRLADVAEEYTNLLNAQRLLSSVSDDNTEATLLFITDVINKALAEIFKGDRRRIYLNKKLYAGSKPHIVVELEDGSGSRLDLSLQSGTGLRQIISVLFVICLIEIRKGRRLLILDERLSGLHKEAKRILSDIIRIFAEGGFQFIFVEYSLNDIGKLYNVEKPGNEAFAFPLGGREYSDSEVFLFTEEADLSVLDSDYVEDFEDLE